MKAESVMDNVEEDACYHEHKLLCVNQRSGIVRNVMPIIDNQFQLKYWIWKENPSGHYFTISNRASSWVYLIKDGLKIGIMDKQRYM